MDTPLEFLRLGRQHSSSQIWYLFLNSFLKSNISVCCESCIKIYVLLAISSTLDAKSFNLHKEGLPTSATLIDFYSKNLSQVNTLLSHVTKAGKHAHHIFLLTFLGFQQSAEDNDLLKFETKPVKNEGIH